MKHLKLTNLSFAIILSSKIDNMRKKTEGWVDVNCECNKNGRRAQKKIILFNLMKLFSSFANIYLKQMVSLKVVLMFEKGN